MGIQLVSDTTTASVRVANAHGRGSECHMKGPAAIVVSRLKGATDAICAFPPRARTYPEPPRMEA